MAFFLLSPQPASAGNEADVQDKCRADRKWEAPVGIPILLGAFDGQMRVLILQAMSESEIAK